ncbi:hypothetical protein N402_08115 [Helicobacter pylori FD423]|nr:hypothetical protein N402_08115 [Helicobacter pylori FD423]
MRWHDFTLKNQRISKSVFKTPKFKANPPMKFRFFFFVKSAPMLVTLFPL